MRNVGTSTVRKETTKVPAPPTPMVTAPTIAIIESEATPNTPMTSSKIPNSSSGRTRGCDERLPPARLPSPSPSIKELTTSVTASMFDPKIPNRARCQIIW